MRLLTECNNKLCPFCPCNVMKNRESVFKEFSFPEAFPEAMPAEAVLVQF